MDTLIWIGQGILAFIFLVSGFFKSTHTERWLVTHNQTGVEGLPSHLIKFIGICELLGSAGLILPWYIQIAPVLTPIAASLFAVVMMLAAPIHYKRKELQNVAINVSIMVLCILVAIGRFKDFAAE